MRGDGNCFYRALAAFLHGDQEGHGGVREALISHARAEEAVLAPYVVLPDGDE
jgi:hypothetical protein